MLQQITPLQLQNGIHMVAIHHNHHHLIGG